MKESIVKNKAFAFAKQSIDLYKILLSKNEFILSKQFLRSATSIGANINEALAGQSKKDFTAKMSISSKEARETLYWIELLEYANFINYDYSLLKIIGPNLLICFIQLLKTSKK